MSLADDNGPEGGGDDIVAGEYVVGVLPEEERRQVSARIESDAAFARLIDRWEERLSPLASAYGEVAPPPGLKQAIDRRLFRAGTEQASGTLSTAARGSFWNSLAFWRSMTALVLVALALVAVIPLLRPPVSEPERLVASLAADKSDVRYVAFYDDATGTLSLSHLSGDRGAGHDYELWMIEGQNKPVSLGVIPPGDKAEIPVTRNEAGSLKPGVTFAISLEPPGGSPTGQPTGPVVAAGGLKQI